MPFSIYTLPGSVQAEYQKAMSVPMLWPVVVKEAVRVGIRDENVLTNIVFFLHHPERKGEAISSNDVTLAREWKGFRSMVRLMIPGLSSSPATPSPATPSAGPAETPFEPLVMDGHNATFLKPAQAAIFKQGGLISAGIASGGYLTIRTGDIYKAQDGERVVYQAGAMNIIFLLFRPASSEHKAGPYAQTLRGFVSDITLGAAAAVVTRNTSAIRTAIELELNLLMGIAIGISTPAALFAFGTSVGAWVTTNRSEFAKWEAVIIALKEARAIFKAKAPILYDKTVHSLMLSLAKSLPAAMVSDTRHAILTGGEIMGRIGATGFNGRFKILGVMFAILYPLAKRALLSIPDATRLAIEEGKKRLDEMIAIYQKFGLLLSRLDAEKMVKEVAENAKELNTVLEKLDSALKKL